MGSTQLEAEARLLAARDRGQARDAAGAEQELARARELLASLGATAPREL
jgi:hypothetical protein